MFKLFFPFKAKMKVVLATYKYFLIDYTFNTFKALKKAYILNFLITLTTINSTKIPKNAKVNL